MVQPLGAITTYLHAALQINLTRLPYLGKWSSEQPAIYFHVCFSSVDIYVNEWLVEVMLEACTLDPVKSTRFNEWWHAVMIQRGGYNRS